MNIGRMTVDFHGSKWVTDLSTANPAPTRAHRHCGGGYFGNAATTVAATLGYRQAINCLRPGDMAMLGSTKCAKPCPTGTTASRNCAST